MTFEYLDDQAPPRMDQGRWRKIQQRSQRLRRRTRIQARLVVAAVVIVLGTIAATQVPSRTSKVEIGFEPSSSSSSPSVPKPSLPARSGPTQAELTTAFYAMLGCYEDHGVVVNRVESHMDIYEYDVKVGTRFDWGLGPSTQSVRTPSSSATSDPNAIDSHSIAPAGNGGPVTATTADPTSTAAICKAPFNALSMLWSNGRGPVPKERWTAEISECLPRNGSAPDSTMSPENWRVRSECVSQANKNVLIFITRVEGETQNVGGQAQDDALKLLGYPPGTETMPIANRSGAIVGYVATDLVVGPDSANPPPGVPGYSITDKVGETVFGFLTTDIGAISKQVGDNAAAVASLRSCLASGQDETQEPSPACRSSIAEYRSPFGLALLSTSSDR